MDGYLLEILKPDMNPSGYKVKGFWSETLSGQEKICAVPPAGFPAGRRTACNSKK